MSRSCSLSLTRCKVQTSHFPLWRGKTLSDYFQCPCEGINTFQCKGSAYIASRLLAFLSLRVPSGVASPKVFWDKSFDFKGATVFCFVHYISKHKMTRNAWALGGLPPWAPWLRLCTYPKRFFDGESCACFRNNYLSFDLQVIFYGQMVLIINRILF